MKTLTRTPTVAFVGNPNVGKTTLFNALAGMRQRVGNYPGVTVDIKKGHMTHDGHAFVLVDVPGTYSLAPRSPDEMVAVDLLLGHLAGEPRPDAVVVVVDASNLSRNLYLATQVLELDVPVVIALNMVDVAGSQGTRVDADLLSKRLGVAVVPLQANRGIGLDALRKAIGQATHIPAPGKCVDFPDAFELEVEALRGRLDADTAPYLVRRLLLDVGGFTEQRLTKQGGGTLGEVVRDARQRLAAAGCPVPAVEAKARYARIAQLTGGCVDRPRDRVVTWTDRLDRVLTHRVWGTLVFMLVMFLVFQAIFTAARPAMDLIDFGKELVADGARGLIPPGPLNSLVCDGIIEGVGSVLIFLPQILILFAFIAVLEDCGYMARAAFLMDRLMKHCGLSGKSFIPMLSSIACAVPGIMAARVIENRRDRLATILVAPLMSCSARLPVYVLLIGAFLTRGHAWWVPGATMFAMYGIGLVVAPLVALTLKKTLLRGETPVFVMEMPVYKWPSLRTCVQRMLDSGWAFVRRAGTLILASMILVWALLYFPSSDAQGRSYPDRLRELNTRVEAAQEALTPAAGEGAADEPLPAAERARLEALVEAGEEEARSLQREWKSNSYLGQVGRAIEPAVRPLGWDWKIGMAALASFPAREVVVGTLGIIYSQGEVDAGEFESAEQVADTGLGKALRNATWEEDPSRKVFTVPVALSLMVFFALCCQCVSTLAIIRRETGTWAWPIFTFAYMTGLAYLGALLTYQIGTWFS